jgi:uncharacterized protein (TIGR00290 family)
LHKIVELWSGGKDSALALYEILESKQFSVCALITSVTQELDRVSIHGVPCVLLERQAQALGLSLEKMCIKKKTSNIDYERELLKVLTFFRGLGVEKVLCGDIFLKDVRTYREGILAKIGMSGIYPLWNRDSLILANKFVDLSFKAIVTVVDSRVLGKDYVGREFNRQFIADLPSGVDYCGENGEFHTFVYDGPLFKNPVTFEKGEIEFTENRFWRQDLVPI